jgi:hypothetical protein
MDINPLIADLNKFKEELIDSIQIAIGLNELHNADRFVAHDIAEIKGELHSSDPFRQVANFYNLPREEVVENIRQFTNKEYKLNFLGNLAQYKDIEFGKDTER